MWGDGAIGLVAVEKRGRFVVAETKFGVTVKFDGTNLYIDVPNFYLNQVFFQSCRSYSIGLLDWQRG